METPEQFVDTPPSFVKGESVELNMKYISYSNSYKSLVNKVFIIKECRIANLGNMLVEVVDLVEQAGVQNPYLAEHFNKIETNESN